MMNRVPTFAARRAPAASAAATVGPRGSSWPRRPRPSTRSRPAIEIMEGRALLTGVSIPVMDFAVGPGTTPQVPLQSMEISRVDETLRGSSGSNAIFAPQSVQVPLQAGEIFTASVSPVTLETLGISSGLTQAAHYQITAPSGNVVAAGSSSDAQASAFSAPSSGIYTITVTDATTLSRAGGLPLIQGGVDLSLRPIALGAPAPSPAIDATDAALYSFSGGGLYAWLGGGSASKGQSLSFSGPTGIGFQVGGSWSESMSGSTITYTDTGSIGLAFGGVATTVPLPHGVAFTVTAQSGDPSGLFGQVTGEQLTLGGGSLAALFGPMAGLANISFAGGGASLPQASVGIGLGGDQAVQETGLPVDPAVPYLYFSVGTGLGLNYGGASVSTGPSYHAGVAIDPADPSVGVDLQGIVPGVSDVAVEVSQKATIPYTPAAAPQQWQGTLYGDVYFRGDVDISDLTEGEIPVDAAGSITANLDPGHQGLTNAMSAAFQQFLGGKVTASAAKAYLDGITMGLDGQLSLSLSAADLAEFELPVADASMIYSGPTHTFYVHMATVNAFANTPIASFLPASEKSLDGTINLSTGQFQFTAEEDFAFAGATQQAQLTLTNQGVLLDFGAELSDSTSYDGFDVDLDVSTQDTLAIQFPADGSVSFSLGVTGSASASWDGHSWSEPVSYSWNGTGDLNYMESVIDSAVQDILSNIAPSVESWAEHTAKSIWDKIKDWFKHTF